MKCIRPRMRGLLVPSLLFVAVFLIHPDAARAQDDAEQAARILFNMGAEWQNLGDYDKAAVKWSEFIAKYPTDSRSARVRYFLGICRLRTRKHAEAVKSFQEMLSLHPESPYAGAARYNLGMALYEIALASEKPDDFRTAAAALGKVAAGNGQDKHAHRALYCQGDALFSAGDLEGAVVVLRRLIKDVPNGPLLARAYYDLGITQQELNRHPEAAATFKAFLDNDTFANHELAPEIRLGLGISLLAQKQYDKAERELEQVAKLSGFAQADTALFRQAECRAGAGKPEDAAKLFAELLSRFPQSSYRTAAQLAAGKFHFQSRRWDDARKALEPLAADSQKESAEAAYWLGRALLELKKPADAATVLEKATGRFQTGDFATYLQKTHIDALFELPEKRAEAVGRYERFAAQFPDHPLTPHALYMAAFAALGEEDYATARRHAEAFLSKPALAEHELAPAVLYIAAEARLLPAEADAAALKEAETFYRRLVTDHTEHHRVPRSHLRIAWCLYRTDRQAEAKDYLASILASLTDAEHRAEAQLLIGRCHDAADDHAEALAAFDAALKAKPDWPRNDEVLVMAARSHRALGDSAAAAERLKRIRSDFPQSARSAQACCELGEIYQKQERYKEAIERYKEVVEKYADSDFVASARYGLAASYYAAADDDNALVQLDQLLTGTPEESLANRSRYLRGLVYQRLKQYDKAAGDLQAFLGNGATGAAASAARYALAMCNIHMGQFDKVPAAVAALRNGDPEYADTDRLYYELAHTLLEQGKPDEAARAFRRLAEEMPGSKLAGEAWFRVGRWHEETAEKAADDASRAAETGKAADAYAAGLAKAKAPGLREKLQCKVGEIQYRQGKYAEAATTLQAQLREHPDGPYAGPAQFLAGESLFNQRQFEAALPLYAAVAEKKLEKYRSGALYQAGRCAGALERWPDCEKYFKSVLEEFAEFPQTQEARYGLGFAMQRQNRLSEAKEVYQQVIEAKRINDTTARAHFMLGEIAFAEKKYDEAVDLFFEVAASYPFDKWQAKARYEAGRCFIELDQKEKAKAAFRIVIDRFGKSPEAENAARLLDELTGTN
ncbi:MAG: tetratricopeptide repeat protein [Planctomycetes bacterium]|nr:tetratricopeptide repeat protein [Planctomycetota bacterium]